MRIRLAALVAAAGIAVAACSASTPAAQTVTKTETVTVTAEPSADTFTMNGTLALYGDGNHFTEDGDSCAGKGGYDDLRQGTQVTVYDATSKILGVGQIDTAIYAAGLCTMAWSVADVAGAAGPYQYEVSHRGKMTISEADAKAGKAAASIGTS